MYQYLKLKIIKKTAEHLPYAQIASSNTNYTQCNDQLRSENVTHKTNNNNDVNNHEIMDMLKELMEQMISVQSCNRERDAPAGPEVRWTQHIAIIIIKLNNLSL